MSGKFQGLIWNTLNIFGSRKCVYQILSLNFWVEIQFRKGMLYFIFVRFEMTVSCVELNSAKYDSTHIVERIHNIIFSLHSNYLVP